MMLWHGTKAGAVAGILQNGFHLPKSTNRLMYGPGVYFADRMSKSAQYCDSQMSPQAGSKGYLFICDVALGKKVYKCRRAHNEYTAPPDGYNAVKANGEFIPIWKHNVDYHGSIMPVGKTKPNARYPSYAVKFNEYVVYDPSCVVIKFLVEIKFV